MPNEVVIGDPDPRIWKKLLQEGKMTPQEFIKLMNEYTAMVMGTGE